MKVVVRCIYYKPVSPSCDIINMDDDTWREFLYSNEKERLEMALKLIGHEYMADYVRELAWIPLDERISVKIKKRICRKSEPEKKPQPTKEEIEEYRKAVIDELKHLDVEACVNIERVIQEFLICPDCNLITYMEFNSPSECANMLCM